MYIRCWGSRGSIPVSGAEFLRYGGDTTCMEIRSNAGDILVIDSGSGIRRLGEKLASENAQKISLVFTHAHADHVSGFPFFVPLYLKGVTIDIYGRAFVQSSFHDILRGIMRDPYCPVDIDDKEKVLSTVTFKDIDGAPFRIGSMAITSIPLSHPNGGLGYRIEEDGKTFVFLTDNELDYIHPGGRSPVDYAAFARDADLLFHDAEYTEKDYSWAWGHSVFGSAVRLGMDAGVKRFGLFHVNQKRTDSEMDEIVAKARSIATTGGSSMECFGVSNSWEITL
jgi:phosphoribosyl 1,2-cyclic phosphodiesterase